MPWPTTDGLRVLAESEAVLFCHAIVNLSNRLLAEMQNPNEHFKSGIEWFDQWDPEQRLWLLEIVGGALLSETTIRSPAAIFDATVDAVFVTLVELIAEETEQSRFEWRTQVLEAYQQRNPNSDFAKLRCDQIDRWHEVVMSIADRILGSRSYRRAESFRDGDYRRTQAFLHDRGLPDDYLTRIPPLRSPAQTQQSVDRLKSLGRR